MQGENDMIIYLLAICLFIKTCYRHVKNYRLENNGWKFGQAVAGYNTGGIGYFRAVWKNCLYSARCAYELGYGSYKVRKDEKYIYFEDVSCSNLIREYSFRRDYLTPLVDRYILKYKQQFPNAKEIDMRKIAEGLKLTFWQVYGYLRDNGGASKDYCSISPEGYYPWEINHYRLHSTLGVVYYTLKLWR